MWINRLVCSFLLLIVCSSSLGHANAIDLSGTWNVRLDEQDVGESESWFDEVKGTPIELPGITGEAGLGEPLSLEPALTKKVFKHLHQRHKYVGAAWYARNVQLDDDWDQQSTSLVLERSIWETTVWINGRKVGSRISLSVPHRYSVADFLKPGDNRIVIRVDNRPVVDIGVLGHAYTDETQTIWNGLIGAIELTTEAAPENQSIQIKNFPLRVKVTGSNLASSEKLEVTAEPIGHDAPAWSRTVSVQGDGQETLIPVPSDTIRTWSEFDPALYRVTCRLQETEASIVTGFREVKADGTKLLINGTPSFMRGTLECCIFPKTGYPPMDSAGWDKVMGTLKEYGLNHLRFHSWCPPEAAFASADRHGIYLQAELPNWTFKMGKLPETDAFFKEEGRRIIREYGHHPSLVFFSLGNELTGDYAYLDEMVKELRPLAPHLLYTSTSYSFSKRGTLPGPEDDFFITQRSKTGWVRGQGFLNQTWPTTDSDYLEGLQCIEIPLVTHEVGQYNVYPNLAELPKYNGNLRAVNYEAIQQDLRSKGRLDQAASYTLNSGKLAALLYKEDIERALRTKGLSGIQLLDLHDFPGQSTATVGLLDSFWDSKGVIEAKDFRRFCAPVVPLIRVPKMAWSAGETFQAEIEIANFGQAVLEDAKVRWEVQSDSGETISSATLAGQNIAIGNGNQVGTIELPLPSIKNAVQWKVTVSIAGTDYANDWNFWVYPNSESDAQTQSNDSAIVVRNFGKPLFDALAQGRRVLFLPKREEIKSPLDGRFIPVFWSPLHFPNQPGSLGTVIDADHPIFADFPTSTHTDWQWWELLATSTSISGSEFGDDFKPMMQFIDKYNRNDLPAILWEAKVGDGSLLVCSLDIESDPQKRIVAAQLKRSVLSYINGSQFAPTHQLEPQQLVKLFQTRPYRIRLDGGSSHPDYPVTNLDDGDPKTIWHTDWRDSNNQYPYALTIELSQPQKVQGLEFVQRSGNPNGRIDRYQVSTSVDGTTWSVIEDVNETETSLRFKQPTVAAFIRFEALSEVNDQPNCAVAELKPILDAGITSVDELGLIEGFNH
ncbi:Beta-galactosidase [Rubripirellula obstinata]|uniref:Beta-galactosidase n=2 Tax=Rubripirellula obstinata TaxID=406547 RepID=A0A5B1CHU6_9BACT|nr:Beta-galactosidase [Rubripirellula obstinata]